MKIIRLDARGFSHDALALLVVVAMAIMGTAYYVGAHAAIPTIGGPLTSVLLSGSTHLCLNASGKTSNDGPIDVEACQPSLVNTQDWQLTKTQMVTPPGGTTSVQAYSISLGNSGKACVGVNAPYGQLALTQSMLKQDKHNNKRSIVETPSVQVFGCRKNNQSFSASYQQWAWSGNNTLINVNPMATPDYGTPRVKTQMCLTATASDVRVMLAQCSTTANQGQEWAPPKNGGSGLNATKPTVPGDVKAVAKDPKSVVVSWQASKDTGGPGMGGYYILRNGARLGSVGANMHSYTDTTVSAGVQYHYTVEAHDTANPPVVSAQSGVATVTTPSGGGNSGGNPKTPTSSISCKYGNDTWSGDAGSVGYSVSELSASDGNPASFSVRLNANSINKEVVGYPSDQCLLYSALPSSLSSSFENRPPASSNGLDYEYAYDIWLTTASAAEANNWHNDLELMVWTYVNGQVPAGSVKATLTDGSKVWIRGNNSTGTVSVVLPSNETSGSVNISSIISQLKSRGYITDADDGTLDVEYGIEAPYGGNQTFTVNSLSVSE